LLVFKNKKHGFFGFKGQQLTIKLFLKMNKNDMFLFFFGLENKGK